jgi:hypothetical protein
MAIITALQIAAAKIATLITNSAALLHYVLGRSCLKTGEKGMVSLGLRHTTVAYK